MFFTTVTIAMTTMSKSQHIFFRSGHKKSFYLKTTSIVAIYCTAVIKNNRERTENVPISKKTFRDTEFFSRSEDVKVLEYNEILTYKMYFFEQN